MAKPDNTVDESELETRRHKAQRARNIAIAIALAAFVIILYVATWAKLGANVLVRPL
ncbi:hypothetical protein [Salaquimonas pukyongi]|uniref:hypothetical protein n=1 Tax=Salaquimonas pukyongi TaxID=2712698 RepID=UPI0013BE94E8|nr:hypothetical protein [Salaquimonas pukyongi]